MTIAIAGQSNAGSLVGTVLFSQSGEATYQVGGTPLFPIDGPDWNVSSGELYASMVADLHTRGGLDTLAWVHGEGDSLTQERVDAYPDEFRALHYGLVSEFGPFKLIIVPLSTWAPVGQDNDLWTQMRANQFALADEFGARIVDPDKLIALHGITAEEAFRDHIHYSLAFAEALLAEVLQTAASVIGTPAGDTLSGTDASEMLWGRDGDDVLVAKDGDDHLVGGAGADIMYGGQGDDTYDVDNAGDQAIELSAAHGHDTVVATVSYTLPANVEDLSAIFAWSAILKANGLDNTIRAGSGNDVLYGYAGADLLSGGAGADIILGGDGNDTLYGGDGNDILHGHAGNDIIMGGAGDDLITGQGGADRMYGGDGSDLIFGGSGDLISGGAQSDTFQFSHGFGYATILDMQAGDHIQLINMDAVYTAQSVAGGTLLTFDTGDQLLFSGLAPHQISSHWFDM